jgi:hypothetical protein
MYIKSHAQFINKPNQVRTVQFDATGNLPTISMPKGEPDDWTKVAVNESDSLSKRPASQISIAQKITY